MTAPNIPPRPIPPFAWDGGAPSDLATTWAEVADMGLEEAPADIGPSDYQMARRAGHQDQE